MQQECVIGTPFHTTRISAQCGSIAAVDGWIALHDAIKTHRDKSCFPVCLDSVSFNNRRHQSIAMGDQLWPLDENLYNLEEEELKFLSAQTGITDANELKRHVLAVQAEIYAVSSNDCSEITYGLTVRL